MVAGLAPVRCYFSAQRIFVIAGESAEMKIFLAPDTDQNGRKWEERRGETKKC